MSRAIAGLYRVRGAIISAAVVLIFVGTLGSLLVSIDPLNAVFRLLPLVGIAGMLFAFALIIPGVKLLPTRDAVQVTSPVVGRWLAINSPATKVPSHGVRAYGQAYAIDLVYEPNHRERPVFGSGTAMRRPAEYPAFGEPVRAMIDGVVVKVDDSQRDHRARSTVLAVVYMMFEGAIRELGGPRLIIGNHVTIRRSDGIYALVAHLQQGSAIVREGDGVVAGQEIAACGNTGNTSEPHVHAQLMDRASAWTGQGVPLVFADVKLDEDSTVQDAVPANNQHMTVSESASR
ncbi:peptidase M23-like protein [Rhodoglobus vestalii]|uniref:Peptidase M23-like protein n=1 Tax=Rhodoglobus vestalii TaxID=193384 RepID=A0A8H2PTQ7_9MICO|nr:M23 family metallopeptidase [Rhodoglobus vestalii]TQO18787.1 peptidase M23-like protein [Rhodoglobus vestalii]